MKFNINEMDMALCYLINTNKELDLWKEIKKIVKKANYYVYFYYLANLGRKLTFVDFKKINLHKTIENKIFYKKLLIHILKNKKLYDIKPYQKSEELYIGNFSFLEISKKYNISNKIKYQLINRYKIDFDKEENKSLIIATQISTSAVNTGYWFIFSGICRIFHFFIFLIPILFIFNVIISIE